MRIRSYLMFHGQCEEALNYYVEALGARIARIVRFGDVPVGSLLAPDQPDKILHAELHVGPSVVFASDAHCAEAPVAAHGFSLTLLAKGPDEGRVLFALLADGATITMPFEATFWSDGFGMLTDRFGVPWIVSVEGAMLE
ncbi:VOC family protein [Chitinibacteraceae bacterium HSL-7]